MALVTLQQIRTAIKTKLDTLKSTADDDTKPLSHVYDHIKDAWQGYPYAMFEPIGLNSTIETTAENYRKYQFKIYIVQEMNITSRQDAVGIIVDAFDAVVQAFDEDWHLWWLIEMMEAVPGDIYALDVADGAVMVAEIILTCNVLSTIN